MRNRKFGLLWAACLCLAIFSFQCGGGSSSGGGGGSGGGNGGGSGGGTGTATLSSLSPIVTMQNGPAFTLTANGTGFASGDQLVFNGAAAATTVVNSTQLTASIPTSALSQAGTFNVTVQSGGGNSSAQSFYVVPAIAPSPVAVTANGTATANIAVPAFSTPSLQIQEAGVSPNAGQIAVDVNPGQTVQLFVVGPGMKPGAFFEVSGNNDVTVTQPLATDFPGTQDNPPQPGAEFSVSISPSAALGPRNLIVTNPAGEISIFPGGIVIVPGS
ncbi:MAG TPA: hypothetical protein VFZ08_07570 [Terriglobia bacterium]|nr:hypothetical protein [Terriglobia bacterium]